jgi:hypothetical protein
MELAGKTSDADCQSHAWLPVGQHGAAITHYVGFTHDS